MEIQLIDTESLTVHPAIGAMHGWADDDPRFEALVEDILEHGVIEPIKVCGSEVVDGRHRLRAARAAGLGKIPAIVVSGEGALQIIISTLLHRRHYSKGGIAYLAYPLLKEAHRDAVKSGVLSRHSKIAPSSDSIGRREQKGALACATVEQLAVRLGISRDTFDQAAQVHRIFEGDPDYRALMEPRILEDRDPVGLGAVIAGHGGRRATLDTARRDAPKHMLLARAFSDLEKRFNYWGELELEARRELRPVIRSTVEAMPEDLREEFAEALKRAARV